MSTRSQIKVYPEEDMHHNAKPIKYIVDKEGCWIFVSHSKVRYGRIGRYGKVVLVHRYVYEQEKGEIPEGKVVMHTCDKTDCINPDHLVLGTQGDNVKDMYKKGRNASFEGSNNPRAKITEKEAVEIFLDDRKQTEIATDYGIHQTNVSAIKRMESWRSATKEVVKV